MSTNCGTESTNQIPAGYYHCGDRQVSDMALRYDTREPQLRMEVLLDTKQMWAQWTPGDLHFKLRLEPTKVVTFHYVPDELAIVKENSKKKPEKKEKKKNSATKGGGTTVATPAIEGVRYKRVGLWPEDLDPSTYFSPQSDISNSVLPHFQQHGFAVLKNIFDVSLQQILTSWHNKFYNPKSGHSNNRGWYSVHEDYEHDKTPPEIEQLLKPLTPYLDALLGPDAWEHNQRLQIAFATKAKVVPRLPNYHIDQMFLNKGEPFSVLIGIPLVCEFDQPLSGTLAIFPNSHRSMCEKMRKRSKEYLDSDTDKVDKINTVFDIPNEVPASLHAVMPGDAYFVHYRIIHGVMQNYLEKDRSVAYLRIRVKPEVLQRSGFAIHNNWNSSMLTNDPFVLFPALKNKN